MAERRDIMTVRADRERRVLLMKRASWVLEVPFAEFPAWLALYRGLQARAGRQFSRFYDQPVAALEAAQAEITGVGR